MSSLVRRSAWEDPLHPVSGPKADLSKIEFIALHYPGVKPGALKLDQPMQVMLNTDIFYRSKQPVGYSFGYNFAVFPSCRVEGRGFDIRNAANVANADGIEDNSRSLAMNIMVNGVDGATPVQAQYARDMVDDIWAHLGRQVPLVPHGHIPGAATPCPGAGLLAQWTAGECLPTGQRPPVETKPPVPSPAPTNGDEPMFTNSETRTFQGVAYGPRKIFWFLDDLGIPRHITRYGEVLARGGDAKAVGIPNSALDELGA